MVILYLHHTVWDIRNMKMQLNLEDKTYCQNKGWSCLANGKRLCCDNEFCILYFLYFFRWGTHLSMSLFPSVRLSIRPSVRPSVAHHISGTVHHLIVIFDTLVKWWYLQAVLSVFLNFHFWGWNCSEWKITITSHTPYLRTNLAYDHDFWRTCVKSWYLQVSRSFYWNFHCLGCEEGKREKYSPKWKITITSIMCYISGTVYPMIMILGTLV